MLTDTALKALKPQEKKYKVTDRDGMYVLVMPTGAITFRYDYRINGRRETLIIGRYGRAGVSLARAREKLIDAQRAIQEGRSPAQEKQRDKRRLKEAKSFGEFGERWFQEARMADSTKAMRRAIFERDILPKFRSRLLTEITPDDLRAMCAKVSAPASHRHNDRAENLRRKFKVSSALPLRRGRTHVAGDLQPDHDGCRGPCQEGGVAVGIVHGSRSSPDRFDPPE